MNIHTEQLPASFFVAPDNPSMMRLAATAARDKMKLVETLTQCVLLVSFFSVREQVSRL